MSARGVRRRRVVFANAVRFSASHAMFPANAVKFPALGGLVYLSKTAGLARGVKPANLADQREANAAPFACQTALPVLC